MTHPLPQTRLDMSALVGGLDRRQLRAFRRTLPVEVRAGLWRAVWPGLVVIGFPLIFLGLWTSALGAWFIDDGEWEWSLLVLMLPYVVLPVVGIVLLVRALRRRNGVRQFRLSRFAATNGFDYEPYVDSPPLPGMIFRRPGRMSEFAADVVRRRTGEAFEVGNHVSIVKAGRSTTTHRWGYAMMRLPIALPHIVLDAQANNSVRRPRLPVAYANDQRLSLEGDFDRHFALFCPRGYERDALYLFSPEVMVQFIDTVATLDVEIVDDHVFLYAPGELSTLDPVAWERLIASIEVLSRRVEQWGRWRDDRRPGGIEVFPIQGVARQGRRLAPRAEWWWLLGVPLAIFGFYRIIVEAFGSWGQ